jgi:hypothetical protein
MDSPWNDILFFPGEDPEALKTRFVELCVSFGDRFTHYQIAQTVFKNLKDPELRAGKAAEVWGNDLEVLERIKTGIREGLETPDANLPALIRRAIAIADADYTEPKDRISAIRLAGELQGLVKKSVDTKVAMSGGIDLAKLAEKLPG